MSKTIKFIEFIYEDKILTPSVIWQKGESQNGGNKNTKHAKFSEKRTFFTHTYTHVSFSENLAYFVFLVPPF